MKKLSLLFISISILLVTPLLLFASPISVQHNIADGDLLTTQDSFDIYIIKVIEEKKFKRLILNPDIFNSYGHLSWDNVKTVPQATLDGYALSEFVIEVDSDGAVADPKVYKLSSLADSDVGERRWLNITAQEFESLGYDWDSIYHINSTEASEDFYPTGSQLTFEELSGDEKEDQVLQEGGPGPPSTDEEVAETKIISFSRPDCDLEVPTSHATIQSAIDSASAGDKICLLAGAYTENIIIDGKTITLSGVSSASTTVRGYGIEGSTVVIKNVSAAMVTENLTIENGSDYGIWVEDASPVIKNNIIKDNFAGMRIYGNSRPDVRYNIFADNAEGAIVHNGNYGDYEIDHNTFADNGTAAGKSAILFSSSFTGSPVSVTNNIISGGVYGIHEPGQFNSILNNNLFYNQTGAYVRKEYSSYNSASALNDLSQATGNKAGDPLLDADYKPLSGSPALGAADDRQSNMGAY